jgi:hypothetical protein
VPPQAALTAEERRIMAGVIDQLAAGAGS